MTTEQSGLWGGSLEVQERAKIGALAERFVVPPFSILDTRQGYWQERKKAWLRLGIQGECRQHSMGDPSGRTRGLIGGSAWDGTWVKKKRLKGLAGNSPGTSIFSPVLCELAYSWFCPPDGSVLDPFAGGSVRGIVAAKLAYQYVGIELRPEQVEANQGQAERIEVEPIWMVGDSYYVQELAPGRYDFLFSCPPYYDLEVYSDLQGELSAMPSYEAFLERYWHIISECVDMLKPNRFACFVVSDIRAGEGHYRGFPSDTVRGFAYAGCELYNEAILINSLGSLPIRVGKQFKSGRKLGRTHQNVLIFIKGDWRQAVAELEISRIR